MLTEAGVVAHVIATLAFAALGLRSARARVSGDRAGAWLIGASLVTALWALAFVLAARDVAAGGVAMPLLETARVGVWGGFVAALLARDGGGRAPGSRSVVTAFAGLVTLQLALDLVAVLSPVAEGDPNPLGLPYLLARLALAVAGLVLVHNLYINTAPSSRWSVRLLCIGLGGLFGYDLNLYTVALLGGGLPRDLFNIRGLVDAIVVVPVALAARRSEGFQIRLSRDVVFQTFSLVGIGGYFVAMSVAGYGLRAVGGDWGRLLQIGFVFVAILTGLAVLLSGRFRAWARVKINKHFFAYKYDYRQEWLRFIATLSGGGEGTLPERVVKAVCQLVDSPAGVLLVADGDGEPFVPGARWNPLTLDVAEAADGPLARFLGGEGRIVDLDALRQGQGHGDLPLPSWAADRRLWLVCPLIHLERLIGFIVMERSLAPRALNWEDFDLLRTAGRQAASYIAESASQRALMEARKFDEFNRRFAFILHDVKNVVSQLSLVARNAERHGAKPEFQADMAATLKNSVGRLGDLLSRLGAREARGRTADRFDLTECVRGVAERMRRAHAHLQLDLAADPLWVEADGPRVEQALEHLTRNAIDACAPTDAVRLRLRRDGDHARVSIEDDGQGMAPEFVRDGLFEPFHSTKDGGFGVGAYEAREIVRGARGRLSVASVVGEGTTFTVLLPLAGAGVGSA